MARSGRSRSIRSDGYGSARWSGGARCAWWAGMLAVLMVMFASPAWGITIRHDRLDADYQALAAQAQFEAVGRYFTGSSFCSFTLIHPEWALTAAHCVDRNLDGDISNENPNNHVFTVGGEQRRAVELYVPSSWDGNINNGFDIALARLEAPITTVTPATVYTEFNELGQTITAVGLGQGGTGQTGATGSSGTKRAGENVIDRYVTFRNGATGLWWDFDEPAPRVSPNQGGSTTPLDMEMNLAPGDSGGATFMFENDAWFLVGVNSGTYNLFNYPGAVGDSRSTYGDASLVTRVSAYQHFIFTTIPEPGSVLMFLVVIGVAAGRRPGQRLRRGSSGVVLGPAGRLV